MRLQTITRPSFLKIIPPLHYSIVIKTDLALETPWHFHPEIELLYCIKGKGTSFIGNSIRSIEEGELLLFGQNLPHTRLGDMNYYKKHSKEKPEAIVIQFLENFLGPAFFNVSEFKHIRGLIDRASRGLIFHGGIRNKVIHQLLNIRNSSGLTSILELLNILDLLATSNEYSYINPIHYNIVIADKSKEKINKVYEYTVHHFREVIRLKEVASLTNHSLSAFCRYFKAHARKSYFQYLIETRVAYACEQIREADQDLNQICYASGFNNLSNFHKQFKKVTSLTPSQYRIKSLKKNS